MYCVETIEINQAVRNNRDKFTTSYMFELSNSELYDLRSKIFTTNVSSKSRSTTKLFTERGLYMLASILKGEAPPQGEIGLMWIEMRKMLLSIWKQVRFMSTWRV